ncbi:MAG: GGDEF domain-containing protein [Oscillospiraceae bacterium]
MLEFFILFGGWFKQIFFTVSVFLIHIIALRSMVESIFSWIFNVPINTILIDCSYSMFSTAVSFTIVNALIYLCVKFMPSEEQKNINQHREQINFMNVWIVLFNVYLCLNYIIYSQATNHHFFITLNQIITPITILISLYIFLFYSFRTAELLEYKEKNRQLEESIQTEQHYRTTIERQSLTSYRFNLNQDEILDGFDYYKNQLEESDFNYTRFIKLYCDNFIHEEDRQYFLHHCEINKIIALYESGVSELSIDYRKLKKNATFFWVRNTINLSYHVSTNEMIGYGNIRNIHKQKLKEIDLEHKAKRDSLTGLYNKIETAKEITYAIETVENQNLISALIIIDIDDFKGINDYFGHSVGDKVLIEIANILNQTFRKEDIIGRIGGDEFIVYMKNLSDLDIIKLKLDGCLNQLSNSNITSGAERVPILASFGISIYPENAHDFDTLYQLADSALYKSKELGKNTYNFYKSV